MHARHVGRPVLSNHWNRGPQFTQMRSPHIDPRIGVCSPSESRRQAERRETCACTATTSLALTHRLGFLPMPRLHRPIQEHKNLWMNLRLSPSIFWRFLQGVFSRRNNSNILPCLPRASDSSWIIFGLVIVLLHLAFEYIDSVPRGPGVDSPCCTPVSDTVIRHQLYDLRQASK
jgi:hypothetical protein